MVFGQYNHKTTYQALLPQPLWKKALTWIEEHGKALPAGEHEINKRDMYANIQCIQTIPESEGVFEVHQEYIDLHYCVEGGEIIAHTPVEPLIEKTAYDEEKDYQLFIPSTQASTCLMRPNDFAVFLPGEKHMPKIQDGIHGEIKKIVIKIRKSLLV